MFVKYPDFSKLVGYDCKNKEKPLYLLKDVQIKTSFENIKTLIIKKGFISDGCTIPRPFRWLFGCNHTPEYIPAAITHDFCCENKNKIPRKEVSELFEIMLILEGVNPKKAKQMAFWMDLYQRYINRWK